MTTYGEIDQVCAVCNRPSKQFTILSSWSGSHSLIATERALDTRCIDLNQLRLLVQICPHCGYCAERICDEIDAAPEALNSKAYKKILNHEEIPQTAKAFLGLGIIASKSGKFVQAGRHALCASWVCDDKDQPHEANRARKQAIEYFLRAKKLNQAFADADGQELLLVELFRRTGQMTEARELVKPLTKADRQDARLIAHFQKFLISKNDTANHAMKGAEAFGNKIVNDCSDIPKKAQCLIDSFAHDANIRWWGARTQLVQMVTVNNVESIMRGIPEFRREETIIWVLLYNIPDRVAFSEEEVQFDKGMRILKHHLYPNHTLTLKDLLILEKARLYSIISSCQEALLKTDTYRPFVRQSLVMNQDLHESVSEILELYGVREIPDEELDERLPEPVNEFVAKLNDSSPEVQIEAIQMLTAMESHARPYVENIYKLLADTDDEVRTVALKSIEKFGWESLPTFGRVELLLPFLKEGDFCSTLAALKGLEHLGSDALSAESSIKSLIESTADSFIKSIAEKTINKIRSIN